MKKYFFFWLTTLIIYVVLFSACTKSQVTGVALNRDELILTPEETEVLIATVYPEDATDKSVKWKSSNPSVATVNDNGWVTAKKEGETTIIVTTKVGNKKAFCYVRVDRDYRVKWIGSYDCEKVYSWWSFGTPICSETYQVTIDIVVYGGDSLIYISERNIPQSHSGIQDRVKVFSDGSFSPYDRFFNIWGNFIKDSIYVYRISAMQGWGNQCEYQGKKIKNKQL